MMSAPMTPGIHPAKVSNVTIRMEPQPLSKTAKGGRMMANRTRNSDIG